MQRLFGSEALVAALLWVLATLGFSQYVALFGNFNQTYGTLGGVIVLLLWFYISRIHRSPRAEVDSELEHRRHGVERLS